MIVLQFVVDVYIFLIKIVAMFHVYTGKLEMQIPWKRLTKDPLVVMIDEIYVIVEPDIGM